MKPISTAVLSITLAPSAGQASAKDDHQRNAAFQDHIAYVATFAMPVLIEKCTAVGAAYLQKAAPLYFRYVNERQDRIERERLLTQAEFEPDETPRGYRERVLASRLGKLDNGTREEKLKICEGALGVLSGVKLPGEWPSRHPTTSGLRT